MPTFEHLNINSIKKRTSDVLKINWNNFMGEQILTIAGHHFKVLINSHRFRGVFLKPRKQNATKKWILSPTVKLKCAEKSVHNKCAVYSMVENEINHDGMGCLNKSRSARFNKHHKYGNYKPHWIKVVIENTFLETN